MIYSKDPIGEVTVLSDSTHIKDKGVGNVLILLIVLQCLDSGELLINDTVKVNELVEKESKGIEAINFKKGEEITLSQLIRLHLCKMSPDTSLLLAKLYREKTKRSAQERLNTFVQEQSLTANCCKNISGRKRRNAPQMYTINDLKIIANEWTKLPKKTFEYITQNECVYNGKLFERKDLKLGTELFPYRISWGNNRITFHAGTIYIILEAKNQYELDKQLLTLMSDQPARKETLDTLIARRGNSTHFDKNELAIVVTGDTYFGEFYSKRRLSRGKWDPLKEKGYEYALENVKFFLEEADFSIINLEAVLVDDLEKSPLLREKRFVLGGQATQTMNTLRTSAVNLVTLATNHIGDYGQEGVHSTLTTLKAHKMPWIGSGFDEEDALCPYRITTQEQDIFIFNGYWFISRHHVDYEMYALGKHLGGNCISEYFLQAIRETKQKYPSSKIIVICHWSQDYKAIQKYQHSTAEELITAGTDLIIGHGSHAIQTVGEILSKNVLYGLGNFVFSSEGEFELHPNSLPYGMVAKLNVLGKHMNATLHFLQEENHRTNYQPQEINSEDFELILSEWGVERIESLGWKIEKGKRTLSKKLW
ncbi:CapA family protein [Enterococcus sp. AZ007]|uniref:CapA family protein n=1 Tax=Enterococcus sp. AZ007 TaxID=2774839 RepID=UPI003F23BB5C